MLVMTPSLHVGMIPTPHLHVGDDRVDVSQVHGRELQGAGEEGALGLDEVVAFFNQGQTLEGELSDLTQVTECHLKTNILSEEIRV